MPYHIETQDGARPFATAIVGPVPSFGDELVFGEKRLRVLRAEHHFCDDPLFGEPYVVVIVEDA